MNIRWMPKARLRTIPKSERQALIVFWNPDDLPQDFGFAQTLGFHLWDHDRFDWIDAAVVALFGDDADRCRKIRGITRPGAWPWRPPLPCDARRIAKFVDALDARKMQHWLILGCHAGGLAPFLTP